MKLPSHLRQFLPPPPSQKSQHPDPESQSTQSDKSVFNRRKRPPIRPAVLATDIYVSSQSKFQAQLQRALNLLFPSFQRPAKKKISIKDILVDRKLIPATETHLSPHVDIHASGTAVSKAVKLALAVQSRSGSEVDIEWVNTTSEQVVDDLIPTQDADEETAQVRTISAIHIRLRKK